MLETWGCPNQEGGAGIQGQRPGTRCCERPADPAANTVQPEVLVTRLSGPVLSQPSLSARCALPKSCVPLCLPAPRIEGSF